MSGNHSGRSKKSQNSSDGNRGDSRRSDFQRREYQSSTPQQGTDNSPQVQGQGGSGPKNQRPEGKSNRSNCQRREYQSSASQQGTHIRPPFQGQGGLRTQNQRPEGDSNRPNFQRREYQPSTSQQGTGGRAPFQGHGGLRSNRGGFVDRKGKITRSDEMPPHLKPMKTSSEQLWKPFPLRQEEIKIPVRPKEAKEFEEKVSLRVNYFPLKIKLPDNIYHYVVDISKVIDENQAVRKPITSKKSSQSKDEPNEKKVLPKYLRCAIHKKLVNQLREDFLNVNPGETIGIISDRSNAIYSTKMLDRSVNLEQYVEISSDDEASNGRQEMFRVIVAPTVEKVETKGIQKYLDNMKGVPITSDLQTLDRVYNTLMKNLNCNRYVPIGRSSLICFEDSTSFRLGEGLLNFKGYNATIEITNGWKPFLNVHVANCATLLNKNVIEVFSDLFNLPKNDCRTVKGWTKEDFKTASNLLYSCKVKYSPDGNNSKFLGGTVAKVIPQSISTKKFSLEDTDGKTRQISIYDYYVERYNRTDLDKDGPCLELNREKYVPAEICEVKKGQSINRKLTGKQTTAMIKCSKKAPNIVQGEIEQSISELNLQSDPILKEFGCSLGGKMSLLELPQTRKLADPLLCYSEAKVTPASGVWDSYALKAKFLEAVPITKWGILYTCKGYKNYDLSRSESNFVGKLVEVANIAGVQINPKPISHDLSKELREREDAARQNIQLLTACFQRHFQGCQIVLVVVPHKSCHLYCHVKQAAEIEADTLTQCVVADSFNAQSNRIGSIVENIVLKVNSKMGGLNHTVVNPPSTIPFTLFEEPVMIVGADVTHGGCDGGHSYAAVTCSIHTSGIQYMMHVQAQQKAGKGSAEVIQNFDVILKKCLEAYKIRTRCTQYPTGLKPYSQGQPCDWQNGFGQFQSGSRV